MKVYLERDWYQPFLHPLTVAILQHGAVSTTWLHAHSLHQPIQSTNQIVAQ